MVLSCKNTSLVLVTLVTAAYAQQFVGYNGPLNGGSGNNGNGNINNNPHHNNNGNGNWGGGSWSQPPNNDDFYTRRQSYIIALHAVLASFAFGCFFPVGAILIKLGAFNGVWWIHGVFQTLTYLMYIGAAVLGFFIAQHLDQLGSAHAIIGLILVFVLAFQPFLGLMHHYSYEKIGNKVFWSYSHIWIGRITITLGIVNGGLGLQLATQTGVQPPNQESIIAYASIAGLFWAMYVLSIVYASSRGGSSDGGGSDDEEAKGDE